MEHDEPTFTVGAMAERLSETGDPAEVHRRLRQLRHFTVEGLLKPVSEVHTGTGTPREYDRHELLKAAVAVVITENFGVKAPALEDLMAFADSLRGRETGWQAAMRGGGPIYLTVAMRRGRVAFAEFAKVRGGAPAFGHVVWLTVDLTEVARHALR